MAGDDEDRDSQGWALRDYQDQLEQLVLQNKKRLQQARREIEENRNVPEPARRELEEFFEEENKKAHQSAGDNSNPFSAFKSFVDSNLNGLQSTFRSLPSNITDFKDRMQREEQRRQEEELDISRRWTGSSDTPDHIQMELSRSLDVEREDARSATLLLLTEALESNAHVPQAKIRALFEDRESMLEELDKLVDPMLAMGGAWFFTPETGDRIPVGRDKWSRWTSNPRWLSVDWFKRSPYSPVRLEAHSDLQKNGKNWRAAFEDLLNASLDKPIGSKEYVGMREPHGKPQSTYHGPGLEWMLSLQCRGILPPLLPRFYNNRHASAGTYTISHLLHQIRSDLPWSFDHTLALYNPIQKDFADLMSEVAIKSTADTYTLPLDTPKTEQDLYDSPYVMPQPTIKRTAFLDDDDEEEDEDEDEDDEYYEIENSTSLKDAVLDEIERLAEKGLEEMPFIVSRILGAIYEEYEKQGGTPSNLVENETVFDKERRRWLLKRARELTDDVPELWRLLPVPILGLAVRQLEEEKASENDSAEWQNLLDMVGEKRQVPVADTHQKPDVLSALTTTRTTRLPDGTVKTEVVLRKRFSDGTETTEESVHTSNERLDNQQHEQTEEKPKKKGWFWT